MKIRLAALIACAGIACAHAQTQATIEATHAANHASAPISPATTPPVAELSQVASPATTQQPPCCRIVADTAVILEIAEPLSSSRQHRGDFFALRLAEPVSLDGDVVIPAGTTGVGQIVDAGAARSGGAPGKLVLAARHLDFAGQQLGLHALKLGASGVDHSAAALGVSFAAGPFAMFIHGGEIEIPTGTRANAKLAANVVSPPAADAPPPPTASPQQEP